MAFVEAKAISSVCSWATDILQLCVSKHDLDEV